MSAAFPGFIRFRIEPVSYTHLDVYKRQMAGCAGFAALLPDLMKMTERRTVTMPKLDHRLLVVCGSVNSITLRQLDVAEQNGFSRLRLTPRQKLDPGYWESENGKEALQGINEMLAANPVSYTHLDVYKRQPPRPSA